MKKLSSKHYFLLSIAVILLGVLTACGTKEQVIHLESAIYDEELQKILLVYDTDFSGDSQVDITVSPAINLNVYTIDSKIFIDYLVQPNDKLKDYKLKFSQKKKTLLKEVIATEDIVAASESFELPDEVQQEVSRFKEVTNKKFEYIKSMYETTGYVKGEDFLQVQSDLNLLAAVLDIPERITVNGDEIEELLNVTEEMVNSLTITEAVEAIHRWDSPKVFFDTVLADYFNERATKIDVAHFENHLRYFIGVSREAQSVKEINEDALSAMNYVESTLEEPHRRIMSYLNENNHLFTDNQAADLQEIMDHLEISIQKQLEIIEDFTNARPNKEHVDLFDMAKSEYDKAYELLEEFKQDL